MRPAIIGGERKRKKEKGISRFVSTFIVKAFVDTVFFFFLDQGDLVSVMVRDPWCVP